jgi:hypothetical protein
LHAVASDVARICSGFDALDAVSLFHSFTVLIAPTITS